MLEFGYNLIRSFPNQKVQLCVLRAVVYIYDVVGSAAKGRVFNWTTEVRVD
jgi:hypothetical protein